MSTEGTTQGDPLAMGLYALSIQQAASNVRQCWFVDDASGAGSIMEIRTWWDALSTLGPDFGYFPNDRNAGSSQNQLRKKVSESDGMGKGCLMYHSRSDCHQKRGAVCQNHLVDQNQNLILSLEICVGLSERL